MRRMNLVARLFSSGMKCMVLTFVFVSCSQLSAEHTNKKELTKTAFDDAFKARPAQKGWIEDSLRRDRLNQFSDYYISGLGEDFDSVGVVVLYVPGATPQFAQVVKLLYKNKRWTVTLTKYNGVNLVKNETGLDAVKHKTIALQLSPAMLLDSLKQFDLSNIPDQEMTHSEMLTDDTTLLKHALIDGDYYVIDIASKEHYHIVEYHSPEAYDDKNGYNKRVQAFLSFMKKNVVDFNHE